MSQSSSQRDTILTINMVEPALVRAINMQSKKLGRPLKGLVIVHKDYDPNRLKDTTGLFEEIICDCEDPAEIQKALKPYMNRLLALTYRYENSLESLRKVIPFLPYVHTPSESSILWCFDKHLMRDRLRTYNENLVPKYQYMEASDLPNLKELIKDFSFPVIVKPSGLVESLLVKRCETFEEVRDCLEHTFRVIQDVYNHEYRLNRPGVLVEEMMQGDMYSTDAYVTAEGEIYCLPLVKVITAESIGLPGFYSYRHIIPTGLSEDEVQAAFNAAGDAIRALNLSASSTHIELYRTPQGWKIIELGARIGGYRDDLYREAYGVEHFFNDLTVRMGGKPDMPSEPISNAAGINIYADTEGIIESIEGLEQAREISSVVYLEAHAKPGDKALFAASGGHLIVDGILSNPDAEQLEKDVARVRELVKIKVREYSDVRTSTATTDHHKMTADSSQKTTKTDLRLTTHS